MIKISKKIKEKLENAVETIEDKEIKDFVYDFLNKYTPRYFWKIPASSSGKYHPKYATGIRGLLRHVIVGVKIAVELQELEQFDFTSLEWDIAKAALILHDCHKHGKKHRKYSISGHGPITAEEIDKHWTGDTSKKELLKSAIASHMGKWNKDYKTKKVVAPKPKTDLEHFVHLCDYLASRKFLEANFEEIF